MITVEQIKAARGLLDWSQKDLAKAARVSKPAVNNIERRVAKPRSYTLEYIQKAFERSGLEFIKGGVRFREEPLNIKILEGDEAINRQMQDCLDTFGGQGGQIYISCVNEKRFVENGGEKIFKYIEEFDKQGIKDLVITEEGDRYFITKPEYYRWVPKDQFLLVPYMAYGDKYAIILWEPILKIIIIENPQIAEAYKRQFMVTWKNGIIPY